MEAVVGGVVSNLGAKVLEAMSKAACKEVASCWGARGELEKVESTIRLIQARVHDAEQRQEADGGEAIKEWLRRLKLVLYQADDLFDEVLTRDSQKQRMQPTMFGKIKILCSESGPLYFNRKLADEIKSIKKQLDIIKSDISGLNLRDLPADELPMSRLIHKRETASFVNTEDVIGRDSDLNNILDILFDPKFDDKRVTVIPIMGFGGLGKTTLAQLVFNHQRVGEHFDLTKWAYVPEKDNLNIMMRKIFDSFMGGNHDKLPLQQIKEGIQKSIENKKYLLVLDDIWDEGGDRLGDLMNLLKCGKLGSKVIVTTRSDVVAKAIGTIDRPYMLGTLTDAQSWDFFKRLAFKQGKEDNSPTFTEIGKEIVKACGNVPLAIKVVGGFLRSKDTKEEWLQARNAQLTKGNEIMDVLKLSYDYLLPALKHCFAYCSLFPKGYRFDRDDLVYMWMAQAYFEPSNNEFGDLHFMNMLARGFFQDLEVSADGNVKSCRMHDLLHDLAQTVAGEETMLWREEYSSTQIPDVLLHVNLDSYQPSLCVPRRMRSLVSYDPKYNYLEGLISRMQHLRLLKIEELDEKLPNGIGRLMHLRYLYIQSDDLKYLPDSITRLENLQTLNVECCSQLRELPSDFAKLTNIRHLLLPEFMYDEWVDFPREFGKLSSVQVLNFFVVGESNGMESLPALNYRGTLVIKYCKWRRNAILEAQNAKLKSSDQLTSLELVFSEKVNAPIEEMNEMLMNLQLAPNLRELRVEGYKGDKMPSRWLDGLSNLVSITIYGCRKCKVVPQLSQLRHLKKVELFELDELEYVEEEDNVGVSVSDGGKLSNGGAHFPCLKELMLVVLPKLKGWTRASKDEDDDSEPLMLMPIAPKLEYLLVSNVNWKVKESILTSHDEAVSESSSVAAAACWSDVYTSLKRLEIGNVKLVSLSISNSLCNLKELIVVDCTELRSLRFASPNSIHSVDISDCNKLRSIEGLQHLSVLKKLILSRCNELEIKQEEEAAGEEGNNSTGCKWQSLSSLRHLALQGIPKLKKLPLGITKATTVEYLRIHDLDDLIEIPQEIGNLSRLSQLQIFGCPKLESLPTSLRDLTSLQSLTIVRCPLLKHRYQSPNGKDLHLIQHIPRVDIC